MEASNYLISSRVSLINERNDNDDDIEFQVKMNMEIKQLMLNKTFH